LCNSAGKERGKLRHAGLRKLLALPLNWNRIKIRGKRKDALNQLTLSGTSGVNRYKANWLIRRLWKTANWIIIQLNQVNNTVKLLYMFRKSLASSLNKLSKGSASRLFNWHVFNAFNYSFWSILLLWNWTRKVRAPNATHVMVLYCTVHRKHFMRKCHLKSWTAVDLKSWTAVDLKSWTAVDLKSWTYVIWIPRIRMP
jgi:hypothetical protein